MEVTIPATNLEDYDIPVSVELPDACPICRRYGRQEVITSRIISGESDSLQVVLLCPVDKCRNLFIATYKTNPYEEKFELSTSAPHHLTKEKEFQESIRETSPRFYKIYNQAFQAEENNLDEICGPGYRKALEYLIKDYLANYKFKDDSVKSEIVSKTSLGQCIESYINECRIQGCAKMAAWLGNDETHYSRKWAEKDLFDLKTLISMTVNWIDLTILSERYERDMMEMKKKTTLITGSKNV